MHADQGVIRALYLAVVENGVGDHEKGVFLTPGFGLCILRADGAVMDHNQLLRKFNLAPQRTEPTGTIHMRTTPASNEATGFNCSE